MPINLPTISPNTTVTAQDYNALVHGYHTLWGDDVPSAAFSETDAVRLATHSYGWGQTVSLVPVTAQTVITAEHMNELTREINAGIYHTDNTATLISRYQLGAGGPATEIQAVAYQEVSADILSLENNRFDMNGIDFHTDAVGLTESNNSVGWENELVLETKASFANYTEARYFFNSGGAITFSFEASGGSVVDDYWNHVFNALGEMRFGAMETYNNGFDTRTNTVPRGFYHLPNSENWIDVWTYQNYGNGRVLGSPLSSYGLSPITPANGSPFTPDTRVLVPNTTPPATVPADADGQQANINGSSYGSYNSAYGNRKILVKAKAVETATSFDVYISVHLLEDEDDGEILSEIVADINYIAPATSPTTAYINSGSNGNFFQDYHNQPPTYTYQFEERLTCLPTLTIDNTWTQV